MNESKMDVNNSKKYFVELCKKIKTPKRKRLQNENLNINILVYK